MDEIKHMLSGAVARSFGNKVPTYEEAAEYGNSLAIALEEAGFKTDLSQDQTQSLVQLRIKTGEPTEKMWVIFFLQGHADKGEVLFGGERYMKIRYKWQDRDGLLIDKIAQWMTLKHPEQAKTFLPAVAPP